MSPKYAAFRTELEALCMKHDVGLALSDDGQNLLVYKLSAGEDPLDLANLEDMSLDG